MIVGDRILSNSGNFGTITNVDWEIRFATIQWDYGTSSDVPTMFIWDFIKNYNKQLIQELINE